MFVHAGQIIETNESAVGHHLSASYGAARKVLSLVVPWAFLFGVCDVGLGFQTFHSHMHPLDPKYMIIKWESWLPNFVVALAVAGNL